MTLRRQMILLIALPTLAIYTVIVGLTMLYTYSESKESAQRDMTQLAANYAARFDGQLREAAQIAETTASFMTTAGPTVDEHIYRQLEREVAQSPLVFGACMAFEPGVHKADDVLFAPYVFRKNGGYQRMNIDRAVYDWYRDPKYTWYSQPKSLGRSIWSAPYFDEGAGNILMATYSAPFELRGKFGGVTTIDLDLAQLHRTVGDAFGEDLRFFFILAADGKYVSDPDRSRILAKTIFDVAREKQRADLEVLGRRMLEGKSGVVSIDGWDVTGKQWVFFAPIRSTNWVFACRLPESRVLADVRQRALWSGVGLGVTLLLIIACIVAVSKQIAAPISRLKEKVAAVGAGNLDVTLSEAEKTVELHQLAHSFNQMTSQLRGHVEHLAAEQVERARIEKDLELARKIQQSLLPAADPANDRLDIAGRSRYCDQTGGDYYDFIDVSHLGPGATLIAVGDVTGHGIASALLMASARAALRIQAADAGQLSRLLTRVNELLSSDNRHERFMTMTLMVVDAAAGTARWASAGHDPAIVFHPDNGSFEELDGGGIPLGIMDDAEYEEYEAHTLREGDTLILATDGIWEMRNPEGEMFGKDRLRDLIRETCSLTVNEMASELDRRLEAYRGTASQNDDITFVLVKLK